MPQIFNLEIIDLPLPCLTAGVFLRVLFVIHMTHSLSLRHSQINFHVIGYGIVSVRGDVDFPCDLSTDDARTLYRRLRANGWVAK